MKLLLMCTRKVLSAHRESISSVRKKADYVLTDSTGLIVLASENQDIDMFELGAEYEIKVRRTGESS